MEIVEKLAVSEADRAAGVIWQIELFLKWLKSILGYRHLLAESPKGVAIRIYSALIAALMPQAFTGKRPGARDRAMRLQEALVYSTCGKPTLLRHRRINHAEQFSGRL